MKKSKAEITLRRKIKDRSAVVGVVGLGYVGLPLAVEYGNSGFEIIGFDINPHKCKIINSGKSDIDDVPDEEVKKLVSSKRLWATTDFGYLKDCDCISICVPTPLNKTKDPDVSYILDAVAQVQKYLRPGQLVVLESTTYPGTTEELILPKLESTGYKAGIDFFLVFSPERVDPGNQVFKVKNTPKIVGGITKACTEMGKLFYEQVIQEVFAVSSSRAAEMVKLLENTFRAVNIGLVNEVALMCDRLGLNAWEIIEAASTKPFGFMPFYPGPGLGGHCIPIDPHYLSWKLKALNYYARFIELAGDINSHMPEYVVERVSMLLNRHGKAVKDSKILVLGMAYKRDIKDIRESPAIDVFKLLANRGAQVFYNDPYVPLLKIDDLDEKSVKLTEKLLRSCDCAVIVTDHTSYNYRWIVANSKLVLDTRNATKNVKEKREKIEIL
ncbi:MAG: UDP-N-acetyl-D-glucosamine dehydrogenase [candidate division Zixibacteria bacterium RBG_16_48_11]|nr:MAG: UDP-N-acetyl-D-glucosamine dehydrogenase [candidate division Zixibacteria bacterium RBG_16_48_11]